MQALEPNWVALIAFTTAWLASCLAGFFISGSLPLALAPAALRKGNGPLLVTFNAVMMIVLAAATMVFGATELRWSSIVIAGGGVFLFAPAIIDSLPPSLKDTMRGHILILALVAAGFATLIASGALESLDALLGH